MAYEHFKAIAESITIPVILYNVPSRTNLNINPETIKMLSEIENIAGVKNAIYHRLEILSIFVVMILPFIQGKTDR